MIQKKEKKKKETKKEQIEGLNVTQNTNKGVMFDLLLVTSCNIQLTKKVCNMLFGVWTSNTDEVEKQTEDPFTVVQHDMLQHMLNQTTTRSLRRVLFQSNKERHNNNQQRISLESYYYAGDIVRALPCQCLFSKVLCCSPCILYVLDRVCCFLVCHYLDSVHAQYITRTKKMNPKFEESLINAKFWEDHWVLGFCPSL